MAHFSKPAHPACFSSPLLVGSASFATSNTLPHQTDQHKLSSYYHCQAEANVMTDWIIIETSAAADETVCLLPSYLYKQVKPAGPQLTKS